MIKKKLKITCDPRMRDHYQHFVRRFKALGQEMKYTEMYVFPEFQLLKVRQGLFSLFFFFYYQEG